MKLFCFVLFFNLSMNALGELHLPLGLFSLKKKKKKSFKNGRERIIITGFFFFF
jgi:hypothetical protein